MPSQRRKVPGHGSKVPGYMTCVPCESRSVPGKSRKVSGETSKVRGITAEVPGQHPRMRSQPRVMPSEPKSAVRNPTPIHKNPAHEAVGEIQRPEVTRLRFTVSGLQLHIFNIRFQRPNNRSSLRYSHGGGLGRRCSSREGIGEDGFAGVFDLGTGGEAAGEASDFDSTSQ